MGGDGDGGLFEFALYLVSCSRLSLEEPPIYGSFRLIEGASRLIAMLDPDGNDAFLAGARRRIEEHKLLGAALGLGRARVAALAFAAEDRV